MNLYRDTDCSIYVNQPPSIDLSVIIQDVAVKMFQSGGKVTLDSIMADPKVQQSIKEVDEAVGQKRTTILDKLYEQQHQEEQTIDTVYSQQVETVQESYRDEISKKEQLAKEAQKVVEVQETYLSAAQRNLKRIQEVVEARPKRVELRNAAAAVAYVGKDALVTDAIVQKLDEPYEEIIELSLWRKIVNYVTRRN